MNLNETEETLVVKLLDLDHFPWNYPPAQSEYCHGQECIKDCGSCTCENGIELIKEASSLESDWINSISKIQDIGPTMEKIYVTSEASQVELVNSPILWECLQVIKSESEFKDLTYRFPKMNIHSTGRGFDTVETLHKPQEVLDGLTENDFHKVFESLQKHWQCCSN